MSPATKWIQSMRALLLDVPKGWHVYGVDDTLYAAGPEAEAVIAAHDRCLPDAFNLGDLRACADLVVLGRISDSGGM